MKLPPYSVNDQGINLKKYSICTNIFIMLNDTILIIFSDLKCSSLDYLETNYKYGIYSKQADNFFHCSSCISH